MGPLKKVGGAVLVVWGLIRGVVDALESMQATKGYATALYRYGHLQLVTAPHSLVVTAAILVVGIGLIFAEQVQSLVELTIKNVTHSKERSALNNNKRLIGFTINDGSVGDGVTSKYASPYNGIVTHCVVVVTSSDENMELVFRIRQNGRNIFSVDPKISPKTSSGTMLVFQNLTTSPLKIERYDQFWMDIISGSPCWRFTAQLQC